MIGYHFFSNSFFWIGWWILYIFEENYINDKAPYTRPTCHTVHLTKIYRIYKNNRTSHLSSGENYMLITLQRFEFKVFWEMIFYRFFRKLIHFSIMVADEGSCTNFPKIRERKKIKFRPTVRLLSNIEPAMRQVIYNC